MEKLTNRMKEICRLYFKAKEGSEIAQDHLQKIFADKQLKKIMEKNKDFQEVSKYFYEKIDV